MSSIIRRLFSDPFALVGFVVDQTCNLVLCDASYTKVGCGACRVLQWAETLANVISDLVLSTGDRFKAATEDICSEALKETPSYENIGLPAGAVLNSSSTAPTQTQGYSSGS